MPSHRRKPDSMDIAATRLLYLCAIVGLGLLALIVGAAAFGGREPNVAVTTLVGGLVGGVMKIISDRSSRADDEQGGSDDEP